MIMNNHRILCFLATLLLALPISAQYCRHEIRAGIGLGEDPHYNHVVDDYKEAYDMREGGYYDDLSADYQFSAYVEYLYHLNTHFAVGGTFAYSTQQGGDYEYGYYGESKYRCIRMNTHSFSLMPSVKATWLKVPHFSIYSRGAIGLAYYKLETDNATLVPERSESHLTCRYQLSPLGLEVGGDHVRFFSEVGYGVEGICSLGITWKFGWQ